jgi:hypothetical protein
MIELTPSQSQAISGEAEKPTVVVDPQTGQQYRLIREDLFRMMQSIVRPLNRAWGNPADDDLIRKPS